MKKLLLTCLTLSLPSFAFAFFCPTNFGQINLGNTIDEVTALCGNPDKVESKDVSPEGPQEWSYYVPQTVSSNAGQPMPGTLKTQMTFDSSGKAVNISVNGVGVGSTSICGKLIQIGDSADTIKSACGDPSFINKQNASSGALGSAKPSKKVTTLIYNSNPPAKLIFEDGVLTEKQ